MILILASARNRYHGRHSRRLLFISADNCLFPSGLDRIIRTLSSSLCGEAVKYQDSYFSSLDARIFLCYYTTVDRRVRSSVVFSPEYQKCGTYVGVRGRNWNTFVSDKMLMWVSAARCLLLRVFGELCPCGIAHRCKQSKCPRRYSWYLEVKNTRRLEKSRSGKIHLTELPFPLCRAFDAAWCIEGRCRMRHEQKKRKKKERKTASTMTSICKLTAAKRVLDFWSKFRLSTSRSARSRHSRLPCRELIADLMKL